MVSKTDGKRNKTRKTLIKYTNKIIQRLYFVDFFVVGSALWFNDLSNTASCIFLKRAKIHAA